MWFNIIVNNDKNYYVLNMETNNKDSVKELFSRNVKTARVFAGLTQEKLAELIGIQASTLGQIESGKYFVKADTIEKICTVLEIFPSRLFKTKNIDINSSEKELFDSIVKNLQECNSDELKLIHKIVSGLAKD